MEIFKKLSTTEKIMIGFTLILLLALAFRWETVWEGVQKGFKPFINGHEITE